MDLDINILKNILTNNDVSIYRDENNNIIIDGNVNIVSDFLTAMPVKIHKINGNLTWHGKLSTLHNFPDIVTGSVDIGNNQFLQSLDGCTQYIGESLICNNCLINDISGIATYIGNGVNLSHNPIDNIDVLSNINIKGCVNLSHTYWSYSNQNVKQINDSSIIITESQLLYGWND